MQARQVAALAEARKKADAQRREMNEMMEEQAKTGSKVNFEIKTTQKIEQRRRNEAMNALREQQRDALFARRKSLADKYNQEFKVWSDECMGREESLEDRKARLMEKAYALRDRREKERRAEVQRAYDKVWLDSCDDLRDLDGRAMDQYMGAEREKQIIEKKERKALEEINANTYYTEWTKRLNVMAEADNAKNQKRAEAAENNQKGLAEQLREQQQAKQDHYDREMLEASIEIGECNAALAQKESLEKQHKADAVARGKAVQDLNAQQLVQAREAAAVEFHQDAVLLQHALQQEKEQVAAENAKKQAAADAARKYRKYLDELMVKEAEDTGVADEINQREADKVQKARDDALQARQDARDYLMKLVHQGREEQIAYKKALSLKEKSEGKVFASKFLEDMRAGIEEDKAKAAARRDANLENNRKLRDQMAEKDRLRAEQRQDVFLEDKRMRLIEKRHAERLSNQGGVVRLNFPKRRPDTR